MRKGSYVGRTVSPRCTESFVIVRGGDGLDVSFRLLRVGTWTAAMAKELGIRIDNTIKQIDSSCLYIRDWAKAARVRTVIVLDALLFVRS